MNITSLGAATVVARIAKVAEFGAQLAAVFHQYAATAKRTPRGFEGAINVLDTCLISLNQVLKLLNKEAGNGEKGTTRTLFSDEGLDYVQLLTDEIGKTLVRVQHSVKDAAVDRKDLKAGGKRGKKARVAAKKALQTIDLNGELKLDEKDFLDIVENTSWKNQARDGYMERLYDIQLHMLLVFQVVTVGQLSGDLSSGKVDVKSIVAYHDRILRTAELLDIKIPKGRSKNRINDSDSDSFGSSTDSDSDSDVSSIAPRRSKGAPVRNRSVHCPPPPPPPPGGPVRGPLPRGPGLTMCQLPPPPPSLPPKLPNMLTPENVQPPAYSEGNKPLAPGPPGFPLHVITQQSPPSRPLVDEKVKSSEAPASKDEKKEVVKDTTKTDVVVKPKTQEARLFSTRPSSFSFRFKSFFRSPTSLAEEMKKALVDTDSHLVAFLIRRMDLRTVPHSAFHSLESTHVRTILSQINSRDWYKTFTNLKVDEHATLQRMLRPFSRGTQYERELVVLKVVEQNKLAELMMTIGKLRKEPPLYNPGGDGRVLLAIAREKFVDGKPLQNPVCYVGPPPPPPGFNGPPPPPPTLIRPPPMVPPFTFRTTRISDLRPAPPPPGYCGPPPPPGSPPQGPPPINIQHPAPPGQRNNPPNPSDHEALQALTSYWEYTMRRTPYPDTNKPLSWSRISVIQESAERHLILQRVNAFLRAGGNVIEAKLRLSEDQSSQVTRLMEDIRGMERETNNFEWCWVEISLHGVNGEITDFGKGGRADEAVLMHVVAKRAPKPHVKPANLYYALMNRAMPGHGLGPPPMPRPGPPPPRMTILPKKSKKGRYVSDSSDSDTDSDTSWSSDSSIGVVRRRLRNRKLRKARQKRMGGSDSEDSDEEGEDIRVKVELKKGDDLVKILMDRWTPQQDGVVGKGKGKAVE